MALQPCRGTNRPGEAKIAPVTDPSGCEQSLQAALVADFRRSVQRQPHTNSTGFRHAMPVEYSGFHPEKPARFTTEPRCLPDSLSSPHFAQFTRKLLILAEKPQLVRKCSSRMSFASTQCRRRNETAPGPATSVNGYTVRGKE